MIKILFFNVQIPAALHFLTSILAAAVLNMAAWALAAVAVNFVFTRLLRRMMRRLPGEVEDIFLSIFRWPVLVLILLKGLAEVFAPLSLPGPSRELLGRLSSTIIALVVVHILWRMLHDIIVYYGSRWARKTESRVDDVIIPLVNVFGPLFIIITATLVILPMWGINVNSVLVGAGVVGLVLGLALQDSLANMFSGISLLVEAPYGQGDLVILPDGRTCLVEHLGMRSTRFYSIDEHSLIYVPNRNLASETLVNITRPTVEQRYMIDFTLPRSADLERLQEQARRIAAAHPAVVVAEMEHKFKLLREQATLLQSRAESAGDALTAVLVREQAGRYAAVLPRLEQEGRLNGQLLVFRERLRQLIRGIQAREQRGLDAGELQEIFCRLVSPAEDDLKKLIDLAVEWSRIPDPWISDNEHWGLRKLWDHRNEVLADRWEKLKKEVHQPRDEWELRLDGLVRQLLDWLDSEYKIVPLPWKDPVINFDGFDGDRVRLKLYFYVDNIRLEHDMRAQRVRTEIAHELRLLLNTAG